MLKTIKMLERLERILRGCACESALDNLSVLSVIKHLLTILDSSTYIYQSSIRIAM